jgi:6-pyruvoyltetrahydropterin/6-carboxytetrahydropterin synthase
MSLNGEGEYCNPSVENIAKEVFLAIGVLFEPYKNLSIHKVTIYETPNCFTTCINESISNEEYNNWMSKNRIDLIDYRNDLGVWEYDDRKQNQNDDKDPNII